MPRRSKLPSPSSRAFIDNHVRDIVAIEFFTVSSATFRVLFAVVVLHYDRRHVVHYNATAHSTAEWTAQQIVEAFPFDDAPRLLIRNRNSIYGHVFQQRVQNMQIDELLTSPQLLGKIPIANVSSVRSARSASIMSSC